MPVIPAKQVAQNVPGGVAAQDIFGYGKDGALVLNSGTFTLTQDTDFSSITLTGTARIDCAGYELRCSGVLDIRGMPAYTIFRSVVDGGAGAATATGGTGGTSTVVTPESLTNSGVTGGVGGAGGIAAGTQGATTTQRGQASGNGSGSGGKGGTGSAGAGGVLRSGVTALRGGRSLFNGSLFEQLTSGTGGATGSPLDRFGGGAGVGGSGGGGDGTAGGGGGGGGGPAAGMRVSVRFLLAAGALAACIGCKGGKGGDGGSPAAGNRGGGGGGSAGGGGYVEVNVGQLLDAGADNIFACDGADGGRGGNGTGTGTGGDGGAGSPGGRLLLRYFSDGLGGFPQILMGNTTTGGAAASGNAGGAGGAGELVRMGLQSVAGWVPVDVSLLWDSYRRYPQVNQVVSTGGSVSGGSVPYTARETASRLVLRTDATSIDVEAMQDELTFTGPTGVGVLVNGTPQGNGLQLPTVSAVVRQNFALPAGVNTVELVDGPALLTGSPPAVGQQPRHTPVLRYRLNGGTGGAPLPPTVPANIVVVSCDSTGAGFFPSTGNQSPAYQGCYALMRANIAASGAGTYAHARVVIDATGGLRIQDIASTAQLRTDFIAKYSAQRAGTGNHLLIIGPIGVNDWAGGFAAGAAGTALDALVVAINAAFPADKMILVTALTTVNETVPNGAGSTLPDFRTQLNTIAAAHPAFINSVVAGPTICTFPGNFGSDQLHPNTAGMAQEEAGIRPAVGY